MFFFIAPSCQPEPVWPFSFNFSNQQGISAYRTVTDWMFSVVFFSLGKLFTLLCMKIPAYSQFLKSQTILPGTNNHAMVTCFLHIYMKMSTCEKKTEIAKLWMLSKICQAVKILYCDLPIYLPCVFLLHAFFQGNIYFFVHRNCSIWFQYLDNYSLFLLQQSIYLLTQHLIYCMWVPYVYTVYIVYETVFSWLYTLVFLNWGNVIYEQHVMLSLMKWLYIDMTVPSVWNSYNVSGYTNPLALNSK